MARGEDDLTLDQSLLEQILSALKKGPNTTIVTPSLANLYVTRNRCVLQTVHNPSTSANAQVDFRESLNAAPIYARTLAPGATDWTLAFRFEGGIYVQAITGMVTISYDDL